jgi:hypothetical protein
MKITRLYGGACYATATISDSLRLLQSTTHGRIYCYRIPRGWRVEVRYGDTVSFVANIFNPLIHVMRSAHVDPQTGIHFWSIVL